MNEPTRAGDSPKMEDLEAGKTYAWCACGNSNNQPYCDGSHAGTEFKPVIFEAKGGMAAMCMCKKTGNAPYCDGSHTN